MKGRYYSPRWHRFINSDRGADPYSLNQTAYVGGSPFEATDPMGMEMKAQAQHTWYLVDMYDAEVWAAELEGGGGVREYYAYLAEKATWALIRKMAEEKARDAADDSDSQLGPSEEELGEIAEEIKIHAAITYITAMGATAGIGVGWFGFFHSAVIIEVLRGGKTQDAYIMEALRKEGLLKVEPYKREDTIDAFIGKNVKNKYTIVGTYAAPAGLTADNVERFMRKTQNTFPGNGQRYSISKAFDRTLENKWICWEYTDFIMQKLNLGFPSMPFPSRFSIPFIPFAPY